MKKLVSIFLAVMMLCGVLCVAAADETENLIVNGGFEDGATGWTLSADADINNEQMHTGMACVQLGIKPQGNSMGRRGTAEQTVYVPESGWYKLRFSAKNVYGSLTSLAVLRVYLNGTLQTGTKAFEQVSYSETEITMYLESGSATIQFDASDDHLGIYVDDVSLVKTEKTYITNGSFDTDINGWSSWSQRWSWSETEGVNGGGALCLGKVAAGEERAIQTVNIDREGLYKLDFWHRHITATGETYNGFNVYILKGSTQIQSVNAAVYGSNVYHKSTLYFTADEAGSYTIQFGVKRADQFGVYLDEVNLEKVETRVTFKNLDGNPVKNLSELEGEAFMAEFSVDSAEKAETAMCIIGIYRKENNSLCLEECIIEPVSKITASTANVKLVAGDDAYGANISVAQPSDNNYVVKAFIHDGIGFLRPLVGAKTLK